MTHFPTYAEHSAHRESNCMTYSKRASTRPDSPRIRHRARTRPTTGMNVVRQGTVSATDSYDLDALAPAWHEFQSRIPVKLRRIENQRHCRAMIGFTNKLLDEIGDRETHPLVALLHIATFFVRDYEERNIEMHEPEPRVVLRYLMDQHSLRRSDLVEIFGSLPNVSEVLNGKREISARQTRALGVRFSVSPAVFI